MKPRITISLNEEGVLEIFLNEAGRDLLVSELQHLSEASDHFHLGPDEEGSEVAVQSQPYEDGDRIIEWGKVMFRPDEWDRRYFPHLFGN